MAKRRSVVDTLSDIRVGLGALPPDRAKALLRELSTPTEQFPMRVTAAQKRAYREAAKRAGAKNVTRWALAILDAAAAKGA